MTAPTTTAAHGVRQPVRMRLRRTAFDAMRAYQKLLGRKPAGTHLQVVGDVDGVEGRLNWYLPNPSVPIVGLDDHHSLERAADDHGLDPDLIHPHVSGTERAPDGKAHLVVTGSITSGLRAVVRSPKHVTVVGSSVYASADTAGYLRLRRGFANGPGPTDEPWPPSPDAPAAWAAVLATGPSVDDFDVELAAGADVRVTCNSAVRNVDLMSTFRPNVLCFGDPVFHFGPSRYARAFRDDLQRALELLPDLVLVIPEHFRSLLLENLPDARGRTVGLTLDRTAPTVPPKRQGATVRRTGNVLTQQMLPMALQSRPRRLTLIGCDGRQRSERYFWRHGTAVQYSDDLMTSVFRCHPSFFRDVSYADYYSRHCREVARWVALAESQGATVDTLTPSFIPVLADRLART